MPTTRGDFRGLNLRDRPFIDDRPDHKYGWEATSRWGSRRVREFGKGLWRVASRVTGWVRRAAGGLLLVGTALGGLQSCAEAEAVAAAPGLVEHVSLGFALDREGRVSSGCTASTFSLGDPIHLSVRVTDAAAGTVLLVSVRDVDTHSIAWSEARPVTPGRSSHTFGIGRKLAVGSYRAETTLGGAATQPRGFVVRERRPGLR
jgi:hypothetical protein